MEARACLDTTPHAPHIWRSSDGNRACRGYKTDPVNTPPKEFVESGLLTPLELQAMDLTAELAGMLRMIAGSGTNDWTEFALHIHNIQHAIMAQAAARAYPDRFRLLGKRFGSS